MMIVRNRRIENPQSRIMTQARPIAEPLPYTRAGSSGPSVSL